MDGREGFDRNPPEVNAVRSLELIGSFDDHKQAKIRKRKDARRHFLVTEIEPSFRSSGEAWLVAKLKKSLVILMKLDMQRREATRIPAMHLMFNRRYFGQGGLG